MRLNAYMAQAGVASRRGADEYIKAGRVSVNGRIGKLNDNITAKDVVVLDGKQIKPRKSRNILLFKPAGYVTTLKDTHNRPKVTDLVNIPERVFPIGRLDFDTTGALLLTNDGDLANKPMHPRYKVDKVYEAVVKGEITQEKLQKLQTGIVLNDGKTAPAKILVLQGLSLSKSRLEITVHEGRKHQVKRMLAAVRLPVVKLHRSKYAGLDLKGLKPGQWRELTAAEVNKLKS